MTDLKVGDIVVIINYHSSWDGSIVKVTKIRPLATTTSGYMYQNVCEMLVPGEDMVSSLYKTAGTNIMGWPIGNLRYATDIELAKAAFAFARNPVENLCACPSDKLFNFGCKCGGK